MALTKDDDKKVLASNRRAHHDYHVLEKLEAGIALTGTEVKSIRLGRIQLKESHIEIRDNEAWLVGAVAMTRHGPTTVLVRIRLPIWRTSTAYTTILM